jgi:hypothetical protein
MRTRNEITARRQNGAVRLGSWLGMALLVAALCSPAHSSAQAKCPWLNAATAAGVLGGDVVMSVTAPVDPGPVKGVGTASYPDQLRIDRFDVTCEFTRKTESGDYTLSIVVKTMSDSAKDFAPFLAQCSGSKVPQKGIGNEAVQCVMKSSPGKLDEQVIARVRDRAFVLTVRREPPMHASADINSLSNETRNTAEQIAGSLF